MNAIFQDNRILGVYSPEQAVLIGRAAAGCAKRIAVGHDTPLLSSELAVISGIISKGSEAVSLGECLETELFLASDVSDCELCLYIKDDPLIKVDIRSKGGMVITGAQKKKLEDLLHNRDNKEKRCPEGSLIDGSGFKLVYRNSINDIFPKNCPYSVSVSRSGGSGKKFYFPDNHDNNGEELVISLSSDGTKASAFSEKSGFISMEELVFICCLELLEKGIDIALPFEFPYSADRFAAGFGCRAYRYFITPDGENDDFARNLAKEQRFTLDGLYLAAKALNYLTDRETDFVKIREKIPKFYTSKKFVELEQEKTKRIFSKFDERSTPDGTAFAKNDSRIVMQPSTSGKGIWLYAESNSMEIASELCANIEDKLKKGKF